MEVTYSVRDTNAWVFAAYAGTRCLGPSHGH